MAGESSEHQGRQSRTNSAGQGGQQHPTAKSNRTESSSWVSEPKHVWQGSSKEYFEEKGENPAEREDLVRLYDSLFR